MNRNYFIFILFVFILGGFTLFAQTNFRSELREANPIEVDSSISIEERIKLHKDYLNEGISIQNLTQQFYGYLFLFSDNLKIHNYVEAANFLLMAGSIADSSGNFSWLGAIHLRKAVLESRLGDNDSIPFDHYNKAADYFSKTGDSLSLGICLEQLGTIYSSREAYDSAHFYYNLALPLLAKYGTFKRKATAYNNYSILLIREGKYKEALIYTDSAFYLAQANKDTYKAMLYKNNLGALYAELDQYDRAIQVYKECLLENKFYNYPRRLIQNYRSLFEVYELKNQYDSAFMYLKKFHQLKDSLTEVDVNIKIAELEIKYESREKELALQKNELALNKSRRIIEYLTFLVILIVLASSVGLVFWRLIIKRKRNEIEQKRENLMELTHVLVKKNSLILELEEQMAKDIQVGNTLNVESDLEDDLINQRILTEDDWTTFKNRFEIAFPGFLLRIRSKYPTMTRAEERLFIFIFMKLTTIEISAILGISVDSVKKTRNRLRKRLEITEDIDLNIFISNFNTSPGKKNEVIEYLHHSKN